MFTHIWASIMHLSEVMMTRNSKFFQSPPHCASCGRQVRDQAVTLCTRCTVRARAIRTSYASLQDPTPEDRGEPGAARADASLVRLFLEACA